MSEHFTGIAKPFGYLNARSPDGPAANPETRRRNKHPMQSISIRAADETTRLEERIASLGPWFHNLRLNGIETAPDHFLGDYPSTKFERFSDALPRNLAGKTVLDIGCNAGFYSIEM